MDNQNDFKTGYFAIIFEALTANLENFNFLKSIKLAIIIQNMQNSIPIFLNHFTRIAKICYIRIYIKNKPVLCLSDTRLRQNHWTDINLI